jgi:hypothetical protein
MRILRHTAVGSLLTTRRWRRQDERIVGRSVATSGGGYDIDAGRSAGIYALKAARGDFAISKQAADEPDCARLQPALRGWCPPLPVFRRRRVE